MNFTIPAAYPTGAKLASTKTSSTVSTKGNNNSGGGNTSKDSPHSGGSNGGGNRDAPRPPYLALRVQGTAVLDSRRYTANVLKVECPAAGATRAWSTWVAVKLQPWSLSRVDATQYVRSPALPPGSVCSVTAYVAGNSWAPVWITVSIAYL